jgi:hypothetical protein
MPARLPFAMLLIALTASGMQAQMRGGGFGVGPGLGGHGGYGHRPPGGPYLGGAYLSDPFLYTSFYPEQYLPDNPGPQVIVVQAAPAAAPEPEVKHEPLMIEWNGDHYARYGGDARTPQRSPAAALDYSSDGQISPQSSLQQSSSQQALLRQAWSRPTMLIFQDGHSEAIPRYAIVSGVIYARGDYYQDGYWTKNIQLSALNIPATVKANRDNGVKFMLPGGPNEVVTRP